MNSLKIVHKVIFVKRYEEGSYEGEINEAKNPEGQVGATLYHHMRLVPKTCVVNLPQ